MNISFEHQLLMKIASGKFEEWDKDEKYVLGLSCSQGYGFDSKDGKKRVSIHYKSEFEYPDCASAVPEYDEEPKDVYLTVANLEQLERIGTFYIKDQSSIKLIPHYLDRWAR